MNQFDTEKAFELYELENSIADAARKHCEILNIPYEEKYRHRLSRYINSNECDNISPVISDPPTEKEQKSVGYSALDSEGNVMSPKAVCDKYDLPYKSLKDASLVAHLKKCVYNFKFSFDAEEPQLDRSFFEEVVKDLCKLQKYEVKTVQNKITVDRFVYTDAHIGMDTSGSIGVTPVYDIPWNNDVLNKHFDIAAEFVLSNQRSNILIIDALGDDADGVSGQTSRGGHKLPQNMSDREMFKNSLKSKLNFLDKVVQYYEEVNFNLVAESNHGPIVDQMVAEALILVAESRYKNVKVKLHERFLSHYKIGKHVHIITHGKDSEALKFGFKPFWEVKGDAKIQEYCHDRGLFGKYIEFCKGDSHQAVFDYTSSNHFNYFSFPAFSPPSNWVKMNFKKTGYGFVFQTIDPEKRDKIQQVYFYE